MKRRLLTFLPLFAWVTICLGQAPPEVQPRIQHFPAEAYGGDNQNWDLAQGDDRTLYVANSAGVLAYDGERWATLNLPGRPVARSLNYREGKLYAGGYGEFGYFHRLGEANPEYVSLAGRMPDPERREEIWNIETLDDGTVVFHSFARLYAFRGDSLIANEAPGIMLFARSAGDHLVIPITGRGLHRWSPATGFQLIAGTDGLADRTVSSFLPWRGGYLIGTEDSTFHLVSGRLLPTPLPRRINRLLPLADGGLAIGTIGEGIYLVDGQLQTTLHLNRENGLGNNTVLALLEDAGGDLWAGLDQGLALVARSAPLRYSAAVTEELGTVYTAITRGGYFYLGTNQGLFSRPAAGGEDFTLVPGTPGQVWELADIDGRLLCAHNDGTFLIEGRSATLLRGETGVWSNTPHPTIPDLVAQATYTGISLLSGSDGEIDIRRVTGYVAPLRYAVWSGEQELLAAHASRGVVRIGLDLERPGDVTVDTLTEVIGKPVIARFGDTIIVQNIDGVHIYREGALSPLTSFRGVDLNPGVLCVPGRSGTLEWFAVGRDKVTLYRGSNAVTTVPARLDGNYPVILPWDGDRYLLCLSNGYAYLDPGETAQARPRLQLRLTDAGNDYRLFSAALPAFDRPVRYRYRLTDRQEDWTAWTERSDFEFYDLWEGDYHLEVQADWFGGVAAADFTIAPPWYRSAVAYLLYALALVAALYILYALHRKRLEAQERRLELVRRRQLQRQTMQARNRELEERVSANNRELANTTLALAKKNEILLELRQQLDKGRPEKARHLIDRNLNNKEDWAIFEDHFNEVHDAYLRRLRQRHPDLTSGDLQLAAYLKMDLPSKEIAPLLHISLRGVENKRYRLRKKLGLSGEDNLNQYLISL